MRIQLRVDVNGMFWTGGAIVEVPELFRECFEPVKTCDEPLVAYAVGEMANDSPEAKRILKTRADAAKILAENLTQMILSEMKKSDTHNGYKLFNENV